MPRRNRKNVNVAELENLQEVADCLGLKAESFGNKIDYWSPFSMEARKYFSDFQPRGKADDVTVIVTQVMSREAPPTSEGKKNAPKSYVQYEK